MPANNDPFDFENAIFLKDQTFQGKFEGIASAIITALYNAAVIAALFALVWSGITYLTAYGNEEKTGLAKKVFIYALVGLVVVIAAVPLINLLSAIINRST